MSIQGYPAPLGTSIRIFLASGGADGVWVVEKSNWTGKALMAPRTRFQDLRARADLDGPGVYLLVGPAESGVYPHRIYIGETDDLPGRLDSHNRSKDFWNRAIVFTSKDANLNKAHIRHIEGRLIALARAANRAEIDNGNVGSTPPLSEADTAEAEAFLAEMLLIYPVLGVHSFEKAEDQPSRTVELLLKGLNAEARGSETAEGFVVFEGSLARASHTPSNHPHVVRLREDLVRSGHLVAEGDQLRFTDDYVFDSPSTAAAVVLGRSANGRTEWKTPEGVSLKELQSSADGRGDE